VFGRTMRLRRYARRLATLRPNSTDSAVIANQLADLWRGFRVKDLVYHPPTKRATTHLTVWWPTLPELVRDLQHHNHLIAEQADRRLEMDAHQRGRTQTHTVLDFYLADENRFPVDEIHLLRRLQGLLQEHAYLVDQHTSHFYQRLSEPFYEDIIVLTQTLIDLSLPEAPIS